MLGWLRHVFDTASQRSAAEFSPSSLWCWDAWSLTSCPLLSTILFFSSVCTCSFRIPQNKFLALKYLFLGLLSGKSKLRWSDTANDAFHWFPRSASLVSGSCLAHLPFWDDFMVTLPPRCWFHHFSSAQSKSNLIVLKRCVEIKLSWFCQKASSRVHLCVSLFLCLCVCAWMATHIYTYVYLWICAWLCWEICVCVCVHYFVLCCK